MFLLSFTVSVVKTLLIIWVVVAVGFWFALTIGRFYYFLLLFALGVAC